MPVHKCSNGKYRIGEGKCMYDSKEKADRAYKAYLAQKHQNERISRIKEELEELKRNTMKKLEYASRMSKSECIKSRLAKIKKEHPNMSPEEQRRLAEKRCTDRGSGQGRNRR